MKKEVLLLFPYPMAQTSTYLDDLIDILSACRPLGPEIDELGRHLARCLSDGGTVLTCGNGGSASDALHLAEELTGRYRCDRRALAALSLCADPTALTCIGNDFGFEAVFSRQVAALGKPGDVLVAFSTSGNSPNILSALDEARTRQVRSVLVTGKDGGAGVAKADESLVVPANDSARVQEIHTFVLHAWLEIVEEELFGESFSG